MPNRTAAPVPLRRAVTPAVERVSQAIQAKRQVVRHLIDGQVSILTAAACFRAAEREEGLAFDGCLGLSMSADAESFCRSLIGWVHLTLADRPEQAEEVSDRLESELRAAIERDGRVVLPTPD